MTLTLALFQGRAFSLGIGSGASHSLVKGIARAGDGTAVFTAEGEDLRPKVMAQLKVGIQLLLLLLLLGICNSIPND